MWEHGAGGCAPLARRQSGQVRRHELIHVTAAEAATVLHLSTWRRQAIRWAVLSCKGTEESCWGKCVGCRINGHILFHAVSLWDGMQQMKHALNPCPRLWFKLMFLNQICVVVVLVTSNLYVLQVHKKHFNKHVHVQHIKSFRSANLTRQHNYYTRSKLLVSLWDGMQQTKHALNPCLGLWFKLLFLIQSICVVVLVTSNLYALHVHKKNFNKHVHVQQIKSFSSANLIGKHNYYIGSKLLGRGQRTVGQT
jgi:hypothetical protein